MAWSAQLGRSRTKLGKWLDRKEISQSELTKWSGVSRPTVTKLCGDNDYTASDLTKRNIIAALLKKGYDVEEHDFW
ncbi:transcriptional regulator [Paenibacillus sp. MCAF20]